jgi:hypothetical protein
MEKSQQAVSLGISLLFFYCSFRKVKEQGLSD